MLRRSESARDGRRMQGIRAVDSLQPTCAFVVWFRLVLRDVPGGMPGRVWWAGQQGRCALNAKALARFAAELDR